MKVEEKQSGLEDRIDRAIYQHNLLEQRLQCLRKLPCAHKKPLSKAEREFKSELGNQFHSKSNYFDEIMQISKICLVCFSVVESFPITFGTYQNISFSFLNLLQHDVIVNLFCKVF